MKSKMDHPSKQIFCRLYYFFSVMLNRVNCKLVSTHVIHFRLLYHEKKYLSSYPTIAYCRRAGLLYPITQNSIYGSLTQQTLIPWPAVHLSEFDRKPRQVYRVSRYRYFKISSRNVVICAATYSCFAKKLRHADIGAISSRIASHYLVLGY